MKSPTRSQKESKRKRNKLFVQPRENFFKTCFFNSQRDFPVPKSFSLAKTTSVNFG